MRDRERERERESKVTCCSTGFGGAGERLAPRRRLTDLRDDLHEIHREDPLPAINPAPHPVLVHSLECGEQLPGHKTQLAELPLKVIQRLTLPCRGTLLMNAGTRDRG